MSDIKEKFVQAAQARLRAEMLQHKTIIDAYLEEPLASIKDDVYFSDIIEHSKALGVLENAYRILTATYLPPAPQTQEEVVSEPTPKLDQSELQKRSPTMRKVTKKKKAEK
tara:strand:- start:808 stop:1140 length:333 start_codon:yes stop_codon:yes gene_type:complete